MRLLFIIILSTICTQAHAVPYWCNWGVCLDEFIRGDANVDGVVDISDASAIANWLYQDGDPICEEAGDVNDDLEVDGSDISYLTNYLFEGGPAPPPPFPDWGPVLCHCEQDTACDPCVQPGDINQDGLITSSGAIVDGEFDPNALGDRDLMVRFINFKVLPPCVEPMDMDQDLDVDLDDLEVLDNYLFRLGPEPCCFHQACWCDFFCGCQ